MSISKFLAQKICQNHALKRELNVKLEKMENEFKGCRHEDDFEIAKYFITLGAICGKLCDFQTELKYYTDAYYMRKRLWLSRGILAHTDLEYSLNSIAVTYGKLGDFRNELAYFLEALHMHSFLCQSDLCFHMAVLLNKTGNAYGKIGDLQNELKCYENAYDINCRAFRNDNYAISSSLNNLGVVHGKLGNFKKQLYFYLLAMEMILRMYGSSAHPFVANSFHNVGVAYGHLNKVKWK